MDIFCYTWSTTLHTSGDCNISFYARSVQEARDCIVYGLTTQDQYIFNRIISPTYRDDYGSINELYTENGNMSLIEYVNKVDPTITPNTVNFEQFN